MNKSVIRAVLISGLVAGASAVLAQQESPRPPAPASLNYLVGVGDVLNVTVWKNDNLAVTVPVRPDGKISLPLVGDIEVAGRTPEEVRLLLVDKYKEFITAPGVSVVVTEINSRRVFVIGEVAAPGVYDILAPMKLMQVLAMAGGLTQYAKKDQVILLRDTGSGDSRQVLSIRDITSGRVPGDNLVLVPGDTIIVP